MIDIIGYKLSTNASNNFFCLGESLENADTMSLASDPSSKNSFKVIPNASQISCKWLTVISACPSSTRLKWVWDTPALSAKPFCVYPDFSLNNERRKQNHFFEKVKNGLIKFFKGIKSFIVKTGRVNGTHC